MTVSTPSLRHRLLIGASLATLVVAGSAQAQSGNLGAGRGGARAADPAVAAAQASQSAAERSAAAQAAAQRTRASFQQASRVRQQMDAAQAAAREAARAAQSTIPNGLGTGGLQVADGVMFGPDGKPVEGTLWVGANGPAQTDGQNGRTTVTVGQTQEKAILTWDSFNVGRETDLVFNQQGNANWITLNRVTSASADPTQILGSIKADGSVYVINPNGVVFGGASQVNVRNLIASSLDIHGGAVEGTRPDENGVAVSDLRWEALKKEARDLRFQEGLFDAGAGSSGTGIGGWATFWDGQMQDDRSTDDLIAEVANGDPSAPGVTVEAGARLESISNGSVVLVGRNINNEGLISSADGQVLLASGRQVMLVAGDRRFDCRFACEAVHQSSSIFKVPGFMAVTRMGGFISNRGILESARGNISLYGAHVRHGGFIASTTGVDKPGSVLIGASTAATMDNTRFNITRDMLSAGGQFGSVLLESGSRIDVLPDTSGQTITGSVFQPSVLELVASQINFQADSMLWAPGAKLRLSASSGHDGRPGRIYLDRGATIDVSGLNGVEVSVSQNSVKAELRANELAGNPLIRDSILRGETVYFDGRLGEKLTDGTGVADLSGWYDLIGRTADQFMTTGGSIHLAGPEIIAREGSTIDLSGGSVFYNDGLVKRTKLIDQYGRLVPIEFAEKGVQYVGIEGDAVVNHARWGVTETFRNPFSRSSVGSWQTGYVEGRSAGELHLSAYNPNGSQTTNIGGGLTAGFDLARIFEGEVEAGVLIGDYQTAAPAGASVTDMAQIWKERPALGTLKVAESWINENIPKITGGDLTIADVGTRLDEAFTADSQLFDSENGYASLVEGVVLSSHVLPSSWFDGETFGTVDLRSADGVMGLYGDSGVRKETVPADLTAGGVLTIGQGVTVDLGDFGSFTFSGRQANIDGSIVAHGGEVFLEGTRLPKLSGTGNATLDGTPVEMLPGVSLGENALIDVSGRWTNNWLEATKGEVLSGPVVDGGTVTLYGYNIGLAEGSLINVNGGAHLQADGKTLVQGDGGSVVIENDVTAALPGATPGRLELNGRLTGYAPGQGGTLSISTRDEIIIAEEWGDLAFVADGVLEADVAAPKDLILADAITLPAGTVLDFDVAQTVMGALTGGETLAAPASVTVNNTINAVTLLKEWVVPVGITVRRVGETTSIVGDGSLSLPAGTQLRSFGPSSSNGTLPAGFVVPEGLFSYADGTQGLKLPAAGAQVLAPAGTPLASDVTLAKGYVLPKGAALEQDVAVNNNFRLISPRFFEGGAGADMPVDWGELAAIADGVLEAGMPAPTNVRLVKALMLAPGEVVPIDMSYPSSVLPPEMPADSSINVWWSDSNNPLKLGEAWEVPAGFLINASQMVDGELVSIGSFEGGATVPAGAYLTYANGNVPAGTVFSAASFPNGFRLGTTITLQAHKGDVAFQHMTLPAGTTLDVGTIAPKDAHVAFARQLGGDGFSSGGFTGYRLSGAGGVTVTSDVVIAPSSETLLLGGSVRDLASGADLIASAQAGGAGASLVRTADLPGWLQPANELIFSTRRVDDFDATAASPSLSKWAVSQASAFDANARVLLETGSEIRMTPESRVMLESSGRVFVDGVIEAKGGEIRFQQTSDGGTVVLGDNARLLAQGYQYDGFDADGYRLREVRDGGRIALFGGDARRAGAVLISEKAVLDVSGFAGVADIARGGQMDGAARIASPYVETAHAGAGGEIQISATQGLIAGDLRLSPGGHDGLGGRLVIGFKDSALTVAEDPGAQPPITVAGTIPVGLTVDANALARSGADNLAIDFVGSINVPRPITFDGYVSLSARRSLTLDAQGFHARPGAQVELVSAYVGLRGLAGTANNLPGVAEGASFTARAETIDVAENVAFGDISQPSSATGFADVRLIAGGDIRLLGATPRPGIGRTGALIAGGALLLESAQTLVSKGANGIVNTSGLNPDTTQFDPQEDNPGFLTKAGDTLTVRSNGRATTMPIFSYGSKLTLSAPDIVQDGVLRAPLGAIVLEATDTIDAEGNVVPGKLTLTSRSVTSVSAEGASILGWRLSEQANFIGYAREDWAPSKAVVLSAGEIDAQAGSVVDLSGGGDLIGWLFTGNYNILDQASGYFAILPGYAGVTPAPGYGTTDQRLSVGDQVYLTGVAGLTDGFYTLLPAAYAQLEGGMLVKPVGDGRLAAAPSSSIRRDDGSQTVSGYRAFSGSDIRPDQGWTSWQVMDSETWQKYSETTRYSFNEVRRATNAEAGLFVRTPADAGHLVVEGLQLSLAGSVNLSAEQGLVGEIDISAPGALLALLGAGQATPEGAVRLDPGQLQALASGGSLLLGGRRAMTTAVGGYPQQPNAPTDGLTLNTTAREVIVGEGVQLSGLEILLAATDAVSIGDNAQLTASGSQAVNGSKLLLSGDGAFVRLSSGDRVATSREDATGASGRISLGSEARLSTQGSLSLDASAGFDLASNATLDVARLDLGTDRLLIGDAPAGAAGTILSLATIERLASASDLLLRGGTSITAYGDIVLGGRGADGKATLGALTFDTPLLQGVAEPGQGLRLTAGALTVQNSGGAGEATTDVGTLTLDVDRLILGDGAMTIGGYGTLAGKIGEVRADGVGSLTMAGVADLAVGRFTAESQSDATLSVTGQLRVTQGTLPTGLSHDGLLGGSLALAGQSLDFDTTVFAPSGRMALTATGGNLSLGANARLDLSGAEKIYLDTVRYAPGGVVTLAASGDIAADAASKIDVSGHEKGGAAGVLDVTAGGRVALDGALLATSAAGEDSGEFALDGGSADFAALNAKLEAGKFNASRDIRLDEAITLAAGDTLTAHRVSLRSDNGDVTIAGIIAANGDAANANGGQISLNGRNVTLAGRIEAAAASVDAGDYQPTAGSVVLAADEGRVIMTSGSSVDLSGGREGGGKIMVRAQRTATDADADLSGTVSGAREQLMVGSKVYQVDTVDAAFIAPVLEEANDWYGLASAPAGWRKGAGIVLRSAGDMAVVDDIDLSGISGPGWLGIEAGGDLDIRANISDGFGSASPDAALEAGVSFNYGIEAAGSIQLGFMEKLPDEIVIPHVAPGEALGRGVRLQDVLPMPYTTTEDWELPLNVGVQDSDGNYYFNSSGSSLPNVVPAGTTIVNDQGSRLAATYIVQAEIFPDGISFAPEVRPVPVERHLIRTGTGDVGIRAGRDINVGIGSAIYTAGAATPTETGFIREPGLVIGEFPTSGGNLSLSARRDIVTAPIEQTATAWLFRHGGVNWDAAQGNPFETAVTRQTSWSIVFRNFQFGVGALGGGNVDVRAGGDTTDLAIALPSTGHLTTAIGQRALAQDLVLRGGGDLSVRALGNIDGGSFVIGRGRADLVAGRDIGMGKETGVRKEDPNNARSPVETRGLAPLFGLMDGQVRLTAGGSLDLEGVYDVGLMPQICENIGGGCTPGSAGSGGTVWVGYSDRAGVDALAVGGPLTLRFNGVAAATLTETNANTAMHVKLTRPNQSRPVLYFEDALARNPGQMRLAAMSGDIVIAPMVRARPVLSAASSGTLEMLSANSIVFDRMPSALGGGPDYGFVIEDRGLDYVRGPLLPGSSNGHGYSSLAPRDIYAGIANNFYRGYGEQLHSGDHEPVRMYALDGSIDISRLTAATAKWELASPKPISIHASEDIGYADIFVTHYDANDISTIVAGGDIRVRHTQGGYEIQGPGTLWVEAGGSFLRPEAAAMVRSTGNGSSIASSSGETLYVGEAIGPNYALLDVGADISIVTGTAQGADYQAFADLYLDPANLANPEFGLSHPSNQGKVVKTYEQELENFLEERGFTEVNAENRRPLFDELPQKVREGFLQQLLAEELRLTGIDYNDPDSMRFQQYTRGYSALHLMYPGTEGLERENPLGGDIILDGTRILSSSGGDINLIAPYGRISIGDPLFAGTVDNSGAVTRRGGDLTMLANGTISLARSRAFTMQGGDLLMWTSKGDITAGIGVKTSVRNVPLSYLLTRDGQLQVNIFGLQTGAGIGVLDAFEGRDPDRRPSRMDLLAFFGEVNAGDAGIRVVGDFNVAALRVVNAANIEVSGDAVGIPQIPVVNVGALNAASAATSAVINEAAQLAERNRPQVRVDVPTIVTVTFAGFGEQP